MILMQNTQDSRRQGAQGFSAIEVTMVATVIAILALVALPVYMKKLEEARLNSTIDEMKEISTSLVMAKADISEYPRLHDLDNTTNFTDSNDDGTPDSNVENTVNSYAYVPSAYWNRVFPSSGADRAILSLRWQGPYITYQDNRTISIDEIRISSALGAMLSTGGGPVPYMNLPGDVYDRYPVDAWGTPYLFFGVGPAVYQSSSETGFIIARLYSCGPDGLPGDGGDFSDPVNLRPFDDGGLLGEPGSDDIVRHVE